MAGMLGLKHVIGRRGRTEDRDWTEDNFLGYSVRMGFGGNETVCDACYMFECQKIFGMCTFLPSYTTSETGAKVRKTGFFMFLSPVGRNQLLLMS